MSMKTMGCLFVGFLSAIIADLSVQISDLFKMFGLFGGRLDALVIVWMRIVKKENKKKKKKKKGKKDERRKERKKERKKQRKEGKGRNNLMGRSGEQGKRPVDDLQLKAAAIRRASTQSQR